MHLRQGLLGPGHCPTAMGHVFFTFCVGLSFLARASVILLLLRAICHCTNIHYHVVLDVVVPRLQNHGVPIRAARRSALSYSQKPGPAYRARCLYSVAVASGVPQNGFAIFVFCGPIGQWPSPHPEMHPFCWRSGLDLFFTLSIALFLRSVWPAPSVQLCLFLSKSCAVSRCNPLFGEGALPSSRTCWHPHSYWPRRHQRPHWRVGFRWCLIVCRNCCCCCRCCLPGVSRRSHKGLPKVSQGSPTRSPEGLPMRPH